jgi:hypothetical protein
MSDSSGAVRRIQFRLWAIKERKERREGRREDAAAAG